LEQQRTRRGVSLLQPFSMPVSMISSSRFQRQNWKFKKFVNYDCLFSLVSFSMVSHNVQYLNIIQVMAELQFSLLRLVCYFEKSSKTLFY
jgi:hypothetical protein